MSQSSCSDSREEIWTGKIRAHVDTDGVAGNGVQNSLFVVRGKVLDLAAHDQCELDFIVEVHALGPEDGVVAGFEDRGGGFEEEEGFLGADVIKLFYVVAFVYQLGDFRSTLGADSGGRLGERRGDVKSIRIVSSNANGFAAIGRDATSNHPDDFSIEVLKKFEKGFLCD